MESVDRQLLQLKENYEHMTEAELCALAEDAYELTDIAREALQAVITERGFDVRLKLEPPAPLRAEPREDDEGLINFQWPDNADHAWRWMKVLTAAGIPSFLGPDNVMHLEEFQGRFDGPVSLKIRDVDRHRAYAAVARATGQVGRRRSPRREGLRHPLPEVPLGKDCSERTGLDVCGAASHRRCSSGAAMLAAISGWTRASRRKLPAASPGREKSFPHLLKSETRNDNDLP